MSRLDPQSWKQAIDHSYSICFNSYHLGSKSKRRISTVGDLFDMAVKTEVIKKNEGWYSFNDERTGHGRENTKTFLKDHPGVSESVMVKLRNAHLSAKKESKEPEAVLADLEKDI